MEDARAHSFFVRRRLHVRFSSMCSREFTLYLTAVTCDATRGVLGATTLRVLLIDTAKTWAL
jgi:hypothetical protein